MTDTSTNATPVPSPEGHDEAMAAKFDAAQTTATTAPDAGAPPARPDNVPEKFWDAEKGQLRTDELLKSYSELEKAKPGEAKPDAKTPPADGAPTQDEARQAASDAGLDFDALAAEYAANGGLKPETRAAIIAKGIPEPMLDAYIAGQEAIAANIRNEVFATVEGGEEAYGKMTKWAETALSPAEIAAFDKAMDGDIGGIKLAVAGLQAKYLAANGKDPNLLGGGNQGDEGDVFTSTAQVTAAMRDPRYAKDPAYRAEVQAKVGRSNVL